jgi:hypothetical protein
MVGTNRDRAYELAHTLYTLWPGATGDSISQWTFDAERLGLITHHESILLNAFHISLAQLYVTLREN